MKVLCISAKAQHGKDTAAGIIKEYLESKGKRVLITHYADLVKFVCTKFFNWDGQKDEKGRTLLQYVGTDVISSQQPSYWVDFVISILFSLVIKSISLFCCSACLSIISSILSIWESFFKSV